MRSRIGVFVCILFTCLFVFVSCNESGVEQLVDLLVSVALDDSRSMTLGSEAPSRDSITWTYKLTKMDRGMNLGEGDEALLEGSVKVSPGRWQIEVWGYRDSECREVVYVGKGEGDVGVGGGTLRVVASTTTDPLSANSLDPSKEPKNTAEVILGNLVTEKDVQLNLATYVYWKVDGKIVAQWEVRSGEEIMGNLQGHLYKEDGELVTEETEVVIEVPAGVHDIQVFLMDVEDGVLSSLLWEDKKLEMNCVHRFNGTMPVKYLDYVDLFDVSPSWEEIPEDHMVIGFAYDFFENQPALDKYPLPVYVDEIKESYTSEELNLRNVTLMSEGIIPSDMPDVWLNTESKMPYLGSNVKRVRFNPSTVSINSDQMNYAKNIEDVVIPEGVRDIQEYGISLGNSVEIELPSSLDFLASYALSNTPLSRLVFKNPEGWMIGGEAISSETLSDPVAAADLYKSRGGSEWVREQGDRICVVNLHTYSNSVPWIKSKVSPPLDGYSCYETQIEKGTSAYTLIKIVFFNEGDHTIYLRHDSQCENDYVFSTQLSPSQTSSSWKDTDKHKCSLASDGTTLDSYDSVTYEGVKAGDWINVVFRIDKSSNADHGKAYVLVPDKVVSV